MDILNIAGLTVGGLVALFPLAYVAYLNGGGLYHWLKRSAQKGMSALACSIDNDCPPGFICMDGTCVRKGS